MPYFNLGKKNLKLTVVDKSCKNEQDCFIEIVLNLDFLRNKIEELRDYSVSDISSDIVMTERELEILSFLSEGKNNTQIAKEMNISIHTVKVHLHNIFSKLSAQDRTEAVIKAVRAKFIKI